jgi:murein endopeptidase
MATHDVNNRHDVGCKIFSTTCKEHQGTDREHVGNIRTCFSHMEHVWFNITLS